MRSSPADECTVSLLPTTDDPLKICTQTEKVVRVLSGEGRGAFQNDAAGIQTVINCGPDQQPGSGSI